jgi:zinc protease
MTTIVVVGDVDPAQAKAVFEKYFGTWKAVGPKPVVDPPAVPNNAAADTVVPDKARTQSQVQLAQVMSLRRTDPDYAVVSVANQAFGAGGTSILFHDVRDVHGLVYGVSSSALFEKNRSTFSVEYACDPSKIGQAQSLIIADLKNLSESGLDVDELARGKASLVSLLPLRVSSFGGIARQLIRYAQFGLALDQATIDARNEIAVTNAQIKAAISKWIRIGGFVRVILGPGPT